VASFGAGGSAASALVPELSVSEGGGGDGGEGSSGEAAELAGAALSSGMDSESAAVSFVSELVSATSGTWACSVDSGLGLSADDSGVDLLIVSDLRRVVAKTIRVALPNG
jgi:hypothetical protein